jgi:hypothetical protein
MLDKSPLLSSIKREIIKQPPLSEKRESSSSHQTKQTVAFFELKKRKIF